MGETGRGAATAGPAPRAGNTPARAGFRFTEVPVVSTFAGLLDPAAYVALPDDWIIGLADVVTSTAAIESGRYKAVNTAGAAVVSAVANALGTLEFPFVFGGDGASFAVAPGESAAAREALAATVSWVGRELGLQLRGATVSIGEVRAAGHDVKVARFAASKDVAYAMFAGGGRAWAEQQMKNGKLVLPAAPPNARPDLTGLSCRFQDIEAANGLILSLIVKPAAEVDGARFGSVLKDILAMVSEEPRSAHPVPQAGPNLRWPPPTLAMEARLQRPRGWPRAAGAVTAAWRTLLAHLVLKAGVTVGTFSPARYRRELVENSDFRKFDDGLMMTLDCAPATADRIEARLAAAKREGLVHFGLHRQGSALVTCMVPSALRPDHIHFVDGAAGGYAMAARDLKWASL